MTTSQPARPAFSRRHVLMAGGALGVAIAGLRPGAAWAQATPPAMDLSMYPQLTVTSTETEVQLSTSTIPAGFVLLTAVNKMTTSGTSGGSSVVGPPAGMSMADFMTAVTATPVAAGAFLPPIAYQATILGGPGNIDPGQTGQAIINIPAGAWAVTGPGNQPFAPLTVTAGTPGAQSAPSAAVTITEIDFGFAGFTNVPAGPQIWKVVHNGTQPHMLQLIGVPAGTTLAQLTAVIDSFVTGTPAAGGLDPSTLKDMGGVDLQSKGTTVYPVLNLPAGLYGAACFVPDPNHNYEIHAMEGMISLFTAGGAATPTA